MLKLLLAKGLKSYSATRNDRRELSTINSTESENWQQAKNQEG